MWYESHIDTWMTSTDVKKNRKIVAEIKPMPFEYVSDEDELRDMSPNMVNVIGSRCAQEYYTTTINGYEYIRPFTMKVLDGLECGGLSAEDAEAVKVCHDFYNGKADIDLVLIEKYRTIEADMPQNALAYMRYIEEDIALHLQLLRGYAKYNVSVYERFSKNGVVPDDIRKCQMAAIYNRIFFALYAKNFYEPYFAVRKVKMKDRPADDMTIDRDIYITTVTKDLLEVGALLVDYSYDKICQFDNWTENKDKERIRQAVLGFTNRYGLLGILNHVFNITGMFSLTDTMNMHAFEQLETYTCLHRMQSEIYAMQTGYNLAVHGGSFRLGQYEPNYFMLSRVVETDTSMPASVNGLSRTMKLIDYIRLFFPTDDYMGHFDTYSLMDDRFWVKYSEPMYLFLLTVKLFYDKLQYARAMVNSDGVKVSGNKNEGIETTHNIHSNILSYIEPLAAKVLFNYGEENLRVRTSFFSLIDTISYYTYWNLVHKEQHIIICAYCKNLAIIENLRSTHCNNSCYANAKAYRNRQKQKHKNNAVIE